MNVARSSFPGSSPFKSLRVGIERHPKGEVFTLDRIEAIGGRLALVRSCTWAVSHAGSNISDVPESKRRGGPASARWKFCAYARAGIDADPAPRLRQVG
jgi:hypothetical protein